MRDRRTLEMHCPACGRPWKAPVGSVRCSCGNVAQVYVDQYEGGLYAAWEHYTRDSLESTQGER